ncbi:ferritin-like domain-containing protein [Hymenobacter cellulosilyticus]|uniref:Ferritin-like domain-containing protein n=1 Tax=Hymenobacter cellulosilyticus TaxID=2932248 RepID=A0A8T9QA21_9BACT|nr:ferritin-like domain-containing protein [Hymenobacter cellulosilyticus]UOQ72359.1 ferritin-like domain-containing protein [Hymenobacter cellulosilyticus]
MSESASPSFLARTMRRRSFFRVAGATVAASTLVLAGCVKDPVEPDNTEAISLNLGTGDPGLLNYLFLLEQLEAAFYQKVVTTPPADLQAGELVALTDVRDHEVIHREFFRQLLGSNAMATVEFNFTTINFNTRAGVLAAARTFEDLGVAAYNGAAKLFTSKANLALVSKIASVEARHAAFIRDLVQPADPFSDVVGAGGLGAVLTPPQVIAAAASFFPYTIVVSGLPTA